MPIPMTHLSVQVIRPVCRDSPPRLELSLLCVCPFTAVNALLQHYCNKHASSNTTTVIYVHSHVDRWRSPHNAEHSIY